MAGIEKYAMHIAKYCMLEMINKHKLIGIVLQHLFC